jgi:hypothetical protein
MQQHRSSTKGDEVPPAPSSAPPWLPARARGAGLLVALAIGLGACVDLTPPEVTVTDGPPADRPEQMDSAKIDVETFDYPPPDDVPDAAEDDGLGPDQVIMPDAAPLALGKRCSASDQCASRACRDGYCCEDDCAGTCQTCDLAGSEGRCLPVPVGQDPRQDCSEEAATTCGRDGTCDGRGACRRYQAGTECAPGRCMTATEYAASTCDGNGTCVAGSSRSCAPNSCMGGSCSSSCSASLPCQTGFYCDGATMKCMPRKAPGAACPLATGAMECASGMCIDGVCCRTPCAGICESCNVAGSEGTCVPIPAGMDPGSECPAEAGTTCGRAGGCNGARACTLHASGVPCGGGSCTGSVETAAPRCDGKGVCVPGAVRDCVPYLCGGAACAQSCTGHASCKPGHYCAGNACVAFGPGPALHWKLDETSTTTATDASGNGLHGGFLNAPAFSTNLPPVRGDVYSRAFVASTRHAIRLSPAPAALKPQNDLTISLWFRTTRLDIGHDTAPRASEALSQGDNYLVRVRDTDVSWTRRSAVQVNGSNYVSCFSTGVTTQLDGRWHHVAATLSPTGMKVYYDGVEVCSNPHGTPMLYDKGPDLLVGRHGNGSDEWDFDGNIDDVRIYGRALPAAEIAAIAAGF